MATQKATAFAARARAMATTLEIAYRQAKRLSEFWTATSMGAEIPAGDTTVIDDGNAAQPITFADVRKILDRANDAPGDWR